MKKIQICVLTIILILLICSCAKLKEVEKDIEQSNQSDIEGINETQLEKEEIGEEAEKEIGEEAEKEIEKDMELGEESSKKLQAENIIKIRLWVEKVPGKSEISLNGGVEKWVVDEIDPDVILFDLADEYGIKLQEVKALTEIVGTSEYEIIKDEKKLGENETKSESSTLDRYIVEKNEGLIRAVACSILDSKVKIKLKNIFDEPIELMRKGKVPIPDNALRIKVNSRTYYDIDCDNETLMPGKNMTCTAENIIFVSTLDKYEGVKDLVAVNIPAYQDTLDFECK